MKIFKSFLLGMCAVLVLTGCSEQAFIISGGDVGEVIDTEQIFYASGALQSQRLVVGRSFCGDVSWIAQVSFLKTLADVIIVNSTDGVAAARTARVVCALR